ncbi:His Kinase A (phospho-acceptor) domain-containing protein [Paenibacillus sp. UNCCL117]|uniref:HAMP domain-containing sensor histidine kinase n=1 Tax=unclassified Paenibacillus TaxID=185978 RepID=UPI0008805DA7|nr:MULTISPECIES: HAMP domain-containing sensor histidine kinase [unclassified Paenibacillus]SDE62078.1 His Kinase A (phospho-acceptor) domain-containing protein [Paenibacillus sp. cl123]SFW69875.1 His Kinase A (phospho-acceptor) domain-containing protein [Paenibacillus sp. UNCCL117]
MKRDRTALLLTMQALVAGALIVLELYHQPPGVVRGTLWAMLLLGTGLLLAERLRLIRRLEQMTAQLRRAGAGNLNARVLVKDEPAVREAAFAVNALIEQLAEVQARSIRSEAARRQLLSAISHDIRTPLTSMIGYVDALKDDLAASPEERREYLDIITRKAASLKDLIEDLFQLAKLDADELTLRPETLDLAEAAREAAIAWLPELQARQIELQASIPEQVCEAVADRIAVQRILSNLLKNAVQYGHEGHLLGIELKPADEGRAYEVTVWDRGAGIGEDELPHVFQRMYRVGRPGGSPYGGSGLGLAIVKALVEKQGGRVWAESEPGVRTAFGFSLPASAPENEVKKHVRFR